MQNLRLCLMVALGTAAAPIGAGGLKTHLWVADQVRSELIERDCRLRFGSVDVPVEQELCASIRDHEQSFLAGAWGPDIFPDLVTGQVTTHPGAAPYTTADWLEQIHSSASPGAELAFSSGYLTHAAVDAFMHTYVNAYSGNIFDLADETRNEIRHFTLEKYIDQRLPNPVNTMAPKPPSTFVVSRVLYSTMAERSAVRAGLPLHIAAMNRVRKSVDDLNRSAEQIDAVIQDALKAYVNAYLSALDQFKAAELYLKGAREVLRLRQQQTELSTKAVERANDELIRAQSSFDKVMEDLSLIEKNEEAIKRTIDSLRDEYSNAVADAASLANKISDARARLDRLGSNAVKSVCEFFGLGKLCKTVDYAAPIREEIYRFEKRLNEAARRAALLPSEIASAQAKLAVTVAAKIEQSKRAAQSSAARTAREAAYKGAIKSLEAEKALLSEARKEVDRAVAEVQRTGEKLSLLQAAKRRTDELIEQLRVTSLYTRNWQDGIQKAGREYINTSAQIGRLISSGGDDAFDELLRWLDCYGSAFTPVPHQFSKVQCDAKEKLEDFNSKLQREYDRIVLQVLPEPFDKIYAELQRFRDELKGRAKAELENALIELVRLSTDRSTGDLIEYMSHPERVTQNALNREFATRDDSNGIRYLVFSNPPVSQYIDRDIGLANGKLNPRAFRALRHAVTLSKLALIDSGSLRLLVFRLGADPNLIPPPGPGRYTILRDALRSIDGNHAWQPYGLPYPRADDIAPEPSDAAKRRYGYGAPGDPRPGFIFFRDQTLRASVFPQIFPGAMGGSLMARPELNPRKYQFPECRKNPFPVAFDSVGRPADSDLSCASGNARIESSGSAKWRGFWRRLFGVDPPPLEN